MIIGPVAKPSFPWIEFIIDKVGEWWSRHKRRAAQHTAKFAMSSAEMADLSNEMHVPEGSLDTVLSAYPELSALLARRRVARRIT